MMMMEEANPEDKDRSSSLNPRLNINSNMPRFYPNKSEHKKEGKKAANRQDEGRAAQ